MAPDAHFVFSTHKKHEIQSIQFSLLLTFLCSLWFIVTFCVLHFLHCEQNMFHWFVQSIIDAIDWVFCFELKKKNCENLIKIKYDNDSKNNVLGVWFIQSANANAFADVWCVFFLYFSLHVCRWILLLAENFPLLLLLSLIKWWHSVYMYFKLIVHCSTNGVVY